MCQIGRATANLERRQDASTLLAGSGCAGLTSSGVPPTLDARMLVQRTITAGHMSASKTWAPACSGIEAQRLFNDATSGI